MIPGFEDQLVGLSAGDTKTFDISFPEEYGNEKLAGKAAQFDIEVVKVEASQLPEIDETFIKEYGIEEGTMDIFRADVQENLSRELNHVLRAKLKDAVMTALYAKYPITVPNVLIDEEVQRLMQPYIETAKRQKIKLEDMNLPKEQFEEQAKRRVTLGLLLASILHDNTIELDDAKVRSTIEDMAKSYESPEDVVNWYYADEKRLHDVRQMVLEDQVVEWLVSQATVTDKAVTFADMMAQQQVA
jgi:trigger factor